MEQLTTICGIEACAVVFGPGDIKPSMWPSPELTTELITKFESMSLSVRLKKRTDELTFVEEKGKKLEASLEKINKDNEETLMGAYMHQIENEGKSLDDFDNDVKNRLINFVLEKIKINRKRCRYFKEAEYPFNTPPPPSPPPPMSCVLDNGNMADSGFNIDEHVLNQQSLLDWVKQIDHVSSDFDNNPGNSIEIPPQANLGGGGAGEMLFYQDIFGGFDNNIGSNMEMQPRENPTSDVDAAFSQDNLGDFDNIMEIPSHENPCGDVDVFLPQRNIGGESNFEGFNNNTGSNMWISSSSGSVDKFLPQGNIGAFDDNMWIPLANSSGGDDTLLPQDNFGGFNNNTYSNTWIPPHENPSGDANMLLPQGNYGGQGNFEHFDNNTGSDMWMPPHTNYSTNVDMSSLPHANQSSGGGGDEMAIINGDGTRSSNTSFVDNNYGRNFDNRLPYE